MRVRERENESERERERESEREREGERVKRSVVSWAMQTQADSHSKINALRARICGFIYLTSKSRQTRKNKNHNVIKGWRFDS